ncbi:MAG: hypothetical protein Kow0074_09270 [Candidatus Zixiibacteriota bacterium]
MANRLINERYELLRRISSAARGTAYYAWDRANPRSLLVVEATTVEVDPESLGAWTTLTHPNVHRLYEVLRTADGSLYLVCEYVDALDLDTVMRRLAEAGQRPSPSVALAITRRVLLALADAHAVTFSDSPDHRTLTHGAIDGRAIWLTSAGQTKLTGFGISADQPGGPASDAFAVGRLLARMLSHPGSAGDDLEEIPEPYRGLVERMTQPPMRQTLGAAAYAAEIGRMPGCLNEDQATDRIVRLFESLQTEDEADTQAALRYLRGGSATPVRAISATPIKSPTLRRTTTPQEAIEPSPSAGERSGQRATGDTPPRRRGIGSAVGIALFALIAATIWQSDSVKPIVSAILSPFRSALAPPRAELVTVPAGAEIAIGGKTVGETPYTLNNLSPGPLSIRLFYPGYRPVDTVLIVKDPGDVGPFEPFILEKRIRFSSIPGGATVLVNGRELSDREASDYWVSAVDTVLIEYRLQEQEPLAPAYLTPMAGLIEPTDTTIWTWIPDREPHGGELLGQFERLVRIRSVPSGALVYVDRDTVPIGETEVAFPAAYGRHRVRLERAPYLDYVFEITVGRDSPSLYTVALERTVHIRAADSDSPMNELAARVEWIRRGDQYLKTPVDEITTPYSLILDGQVHEARLVLEGFADTTVTIGPMQRAVEVFMRPRRGEPVESEDETEGSGGRGWVRFVVKDGDAPVAGAEVIGVEKSTGLTVRYGLTDADGEFVTYVPVGDYDWRAVKPGFEGRNNGERIRPGRHVKTITLRLNDRGR